MFLGTHHLRLDDKGRLFLPAKFREQLAGGVVVTRGQEHALTVFPREEFVRLTETMRDAPMANQSARDYLRMFLPGASDEVPDRQGRITLPAMLRSYAGLERDCVVLGMGHRLEIWDTAAWEQYVASKEEQFSSLGEEVLPGMF